MLWAVRGQSGLNLFILRVNLRRPFQFDFDEFTFPGINRLKKVKTTSTLTAKILESRILGHGVDEKRIRPEFNL